MNIRPEKMVVVLVGWILSGCGSTSTTASPTVGDTSSPVLAVSIVEEYPHDPAAFTQGLEFDGRDRLLESSGGRGSSDVRSVDPTTGEVRQLDALPDDLFGEGLTVGPDGVVQLTWTSGRVLLRDRAELDVDGEWSIDTEGWGVVWDEEGDRFITSDGSSVLRWRDADSFSETGRVEVTLDGTPVERLNELELVDGVLYANVWREDRILRVDPTDGTVTAVIDASPLVERSGLGSGSAVLNGIAHRPDDPSDRLWITGKEWPIMFVVDLDEL